MSRIFFVSQKQQKQTIWTLFSRVRFFGEVFAQQGRARGPGARGPCGPWPMCIWALAHTGPGPYGPWPIWALAHMGLGPYGLCPRFLYLKPGFIFKKFDIRNQTLNCKVPTRNKKMAESAWENKLSYIKIWV